MGLIAERYWLAHGRLYRTRDEVPRGQQSACPVLVTQVSDDALESYPDWFEAVGQEVESRITWRTYVVDAAPFWSFEDKAWKIPVRGREGDQHCIFSDFARPVPKTLTKVIRLTGEPEFVEDLAGDIIRIVGGVLPDDATIEVAPEEWTPPEPTKEEKLASMMARQTAAMEEREAREAERRAR